MLVSLRGPPEFGQVGSEHLAEGPGSSGTPMSNPDLRQLTDQAPALRHQLLAWWELHGRHAIPWKLHGDGRRPADGEALEPYPVFVAEEIGRAHV